MRPIHAATVAGGYKALVCVYLAGGNDSFNMFVPASGPTHQAYVQARGALAIPASDLLTVNPQTGADTRYGFHRNMTDVKNLFDDGALGVMANVGTLIRR